jgi:hypothetical protein
MDTIQARSNRHHPHNHVIEDRAKTRIKFPVSSPTFSLMLPSLSTITFYTGEPPINFLRSRIGDIVAKNPWLQGRLVSRKDGLHINCYTESNLSSFAVSENSKLCEDMEYSVMCSRLNRLAIKEISALTKTSVCSVS